MGSRFSIGIFLLSSLCIVFPCIGYAQEKDTIPSMDIGEEESINTTCFPSMEQKPMFVQCKDMSVRERDACFYHIISSLNILSKASLKVLIRNWREKRPSFSVWKRTEV